MKHICLSLSEPQVGVESSFGEEDGSRSRLSIQMEEGVNLFNNEGIGASQFEDMAMYA